MNQWLDMEPFEGHVVEHMMVVEYKQVELDKGCSQKDRKGFVRGKEVHLLQVLEEDKRAG